MKKLYPYFRVISFLCFLASVSLIISTFWDYNAKDSILYFPLEVLMFIIWGLAIFKLVKDPDIKALKENKPANPFTFLKTIFKDTPTWLKLLTAASFILGSINFIYIMINQAGVPDIIEGKTVLQSHGTIIKELSQQEYQQALAINSRQFLGHTAIFYIVASAILWSTKE